ncbi:serine hydrolase domain-containing protein [Actinomadura atramentaria]|uniref:serine hydrolase domain-containing protein n=1 Tax=Actinomadura atramentaria TaxID=1990 RepID=UPI00036D21CB|nr:serine hydrolase domain-containing protein [Actinomadura atramentaria]
MGRLLRRCATLPALGLAAAVALSSVAASAVAPGGRPAPLRVAATASVTAAAPVLDSGLLRATLDAVRASGAYGVYSEARDGAAVWRDAAGVADRTTGRTTGRTAEPGLRQRVGAVTMTFTATAVLRQVEAGRVDLDAPVALYLPGVVPGDRGRQITVRMLLQHTSGIADYLPSAFPSLREESAADVDAGRSRRLAPDRLVRWGLAAPATGAPGERFAFSRTNYVLLGMLLERVTGKKAETVIERDVIDRAGLEHTAFPDGVDIDGPHPKMYESLHGSADPPREYSEYDMSYAWTAGGLVSTVGDLDRFYGALLSGRLLGPAMLAAMRTTVPAGDADDPTRGRYGLGIAERTLPCGVFWGHDGTVFGAHTRVLASADGARSVAVGINRGGYQPLDGDGNPVADPLDNAIGAHLSQALCGPTAFAPPQD